MSEVCLKLFCPVCGVIVLPDITHACLGAPPPSLDLRLTLNESAFLAWCQAYACAALSNDAAKMKMAYERLIAYGSELTMEGINSLGDRHMLLAKAAFPELSLVEMKYNEEKKMEFYTTKGDVTQ